MKVKNNILAVVFLCVSLIICSVAVVKAQREENRLLYEKNMRLNYLSSMMKILSDEIDTQNTDYVKVTASMISASGAVSALEGENREIIYEFLHGIADGSVKCTAENAAFARRCSAAALSAVKGEHYDIGVPDTLAPDKATQSYSRECKSIIRQSNHRDRITFNSYVVGDCVCARRANLYYLTYITDGNVKESVYIKNESYAQNGKILSLQRQKEILSEQLSGKRIEDIQEVLEDGDTAFFRCRTDENIYLIGINISDEQISHFKVLTKG